MELRRFGRNVKYNYFFCFIVFIFVNYYVEVRFYMSLGVKKKRLFFFKELSNFFWLDIVFYMYLYFDFVEI